MTKNVIIVIYYFISPLCLFIYNLFTNFIIVEKKEKEGEEEMIIIELLKKKKIKTNTLLIIGSESRDFSCK